MMEAWFIHPNLHAFFHQFVQIVEHAVGREWDVAIRGSHDFDLHAPLSGFAKLALQLSVEGEVRINKFDAVLSIVNGVIVE